MSEHTGHEYPTPNGAAANPDQGAGLHAPKELVGLSKVWWWLRFVLIVQLARLRFIAILAAIGFVIVEWEEMTARFDKWTRSTNTAEAANKDLEYYCPMHPTVVRDNNKEKCPICFMPLSKHKKGEVSDESLPAGVVSRVQLSPYRIVLAGVRTMPVAYQTLTKEIATVGSVEFDERDLFNVSSRVKGRIDKLFVNQTGQMVTKGEPLALLYSPDLVITVQNLLDAIRSNNADLQKNARDRLKLWGIDDKEIDEVVASGKPITQITIRSPISGHVIKKYQRQGQYVEEGATLYDVADISKVWVQAQIYEEDLAFLPKGSHDSKTGGVGRKLGAIATTRAFPGRQFEGNLSFIFPHVDQDTRTLTVRFELDNKDHELRPGMSATVALRLTAADLADLPAGDRLQIENGKILAVPEVSVIDTGKEKVVFREELPGSFDGIRVELGSRMSGPNGEVFFPVLRSPNDPAGVKPNDLVVAAGSFLIDAETRLNPAMGSIYIGGSGGKSSPSPTTAAARPSDPEDKDAKVQAALKQLKPEDRAGAVAQKMCPVQRDTRLGSMGKIEKVTLNGKTFFVCCDKCIKPAQEGPAATLASLETLMKQAPSAPVTMEQKIRNNLAKLSPADRLLAETQRLCPVQPDTALGSMGPPIKMTVKGQTVFVCCKGCVDEVTGNPDEMLKKAAALTTKKN
jgi:membrane fusion protein, copper/silver efflux system